MRWILTDGPMTEGPASWTRPLRFHLSIIVVTLLIVTSAFLIGLNFYQGRRAALASASQEMRIFSDRIVDRYRTVFGSAALMVDVASGSEVVRRPEAEDQATLGRFLQRLLRSSEYIDGAMLDTPRALSCTPSTSRTIHFGERPSPHPRMLHLRRG
jgi:adenylate cyclase